MSVEAAATIMRSYLDALLARGEFADDFSDDVTWTMVGTDQQVQGRKPVRDFLTWMHTQAFDGPPQAQDPGRGRWARGAGGRLCRHPQAGEEAVRLAREAVDLAAQTDHLEEHADTLMTLAEVLRQAGRAAEATPAVRDALRLYQQKGNTVLARRAQEALGSA